MAGNRVFENSRQLKVTVSNPTSPVSGDPVRWGNRIGVALIDELPDGDTVVDFGGVYELSAKAVGDGGNSAIVAGDAIFYKDADTPKLSKKASGYFLGFALAGIGSGQTGTIPIALADSPGSGALGAGTVGATQLADNGVTIAKLADEFVGEEPGLGILRVARAVFDPSANSGERTIGAHGLGVTIPADAIIVGGFIDVVTTFQSSGADAGTIAIHAESADDIRAAVAISSGTSWDAGFQAILPKANTPESTAIKVTQDRELTATVAEENLTAGKFELFVYYVQSSS